MDIVLCKQLHLLLQSMPCIMQRLPQFSCPTSIKETQFRANFKKQFKDIIDLCLHLFEMVNLTSISNQVLESQSMLANGNCSFSK